MNTRNFTIAALAAVSLFGLNLQASPSSWHVFAPQGAGFSVQMPGDPKLDQSQRKTQQGNNFLANVYYFATPDERETYIAEVLIYEQPINVEGTVGQLNTFVPDGAKMLMTKDESLDGHPGKMLVFTVGSKVWVKKLFVTETRIYGVMYACSNPLKAVTTATPFVNSLHITQ